MSTPKSTITLRILTAVVIMALFAIAPSVSASPANGEPGAGLFIDSPIEGDLDRSGDPTIIRARFVDINFDLLAAADAPQDQSEVGDVVVLNLFDDVAFTALLDRLELNRSGSYSWIGHLEGVAHSQAILVVKDRIVAGNVTLPGALYQVRYAGGGVHALYQIDQAAFPAEAEPIAVDIEAPEEPDVTPTDDGSSIDVMVVYTADARSAEGGTTAMENLIDLSVADANTSYSNSEVTQRLNLVHTAEVTYTETGDSELDLDRLRGTSDGYMDNVHTLRDTYKADMVSLFVDSMSGCGRGYVMQTLSSSFESWAFSVIKRTCAADNHSFAHELGHNMGCAHDRANASVLGVYDYSYGYQDPEEDFRTVMAYDCPGGCPRVQHFSNPDVNYDGQPTGIDHTAADAADNARTLNNTAYTVANFRKSVPDAPTNLVATAVSESQINLTWDDNSSDETSFRLERSPDETNWTEIASVGANVESYSNTGLNCGTTYYYRVRAYRSSDAKYSGYSNTAHDTTSACPSYSISGYVRDPLGSGINGVTVSFSGGPQPDVTTNSSGYYSQSGFSQGTYVVNFSFSLGGYFFSPAEDQVATVGGADATHDATGYPLYPASLPFSDDFESGSLGSAWAVETDYEGRVQVAGDSPRTGSYSLLLDDDTSGGFYSHASAILALNLSSQSQVEMKFWWREFSDENHPDDGVFISDDYGATWYQALSFNDGPSTFTQATIDLDAQASAAGMSFNDHFLVKFQFYDDYPIVSDGYALDDVQVYATGAPPSGYEISGYVRDPLGSGINGITVDFGGSQPSVTTDSSGHYSQSGFDNGDYTVSFSFSLGGYFFSPAEDLVTVSGANATHDASGYPLYPASLPFGDGFESGDLGSAWAVETDYEGRVRVAGDYPRAGSYSLLLDDDTSGGFYSHASAILALDLSGQSQVEMSFWWRGFGDENHPDDGVFISDDYGATWHQALSFNDGPSTFTQATIDLDGQASAAGLTLNDHFLVKFQFYDNYPITSDGYALDDVQVHVPGAQPPDAPTNLAASAVSDSQIDLTWTDNSADEDSFRLERSPDGSMGWTEIASVAANVESYNDSGLSCGDTYYYRVRAHRSDDGQYSNYSNTAHDTTSACPAGYYNISGYVRDSSSTGLSGMTVNFDGVRPAVTTDSSGHYSQSGFSDGAYTVSLSYTGYAFSPVVDQVTVSGTNASHNVTGYPFYPASLPFSDDFESGKLESAWAVETDYQGRVQVAGDSPHTGSYSLLLDDDTSGGFYSHASAILALDLSGQPQVEMSFWWREFNDESHPDDGVFISDDYGATWHQVLSFNGGSSTFTQAIIDLDGQASAAEMSLNDHFLVKFQFYDNYPIVSDGYALDDLLVYVPSAQPPDAPTNLAASAASESQIDLTWTDNSSNEASFHIERGDGSSGWTEIASVPTNTIAYNDTGLACNTTYYYRVRAYNSSDHQYSDYSNTAHDTTSACPSTNYDISGYARDPSSTGLSGATVNFGGVRPAVTTDSSGHYSQSGFSNGAYTVSLSYAGHAFSPVVDQVTVSNTNAIHDVTGYPFYPASLPFSDSFESDNLGSAWAVETDYEGRVRVDSSYPHTGTRSLLLDDDTNKEFYSHASAILALDLSDQSQVEMSFWWREFNDESHPDDGLFISDDYGAAWHQALSFNGGSSTFTQATIDLDAEASAAGLSLNDHFLVKFQFYDNYSIVSDGYALDDVQVYVPGTQENASDVFLPIIQKPPVGRLQIINNTGGTLSVTLSGLGTKTFGAGTSYWENIPAGTYNLTVTTTACPGTISKSITISAGETKTMSFSCGVADVSMTEGE